MAEGGCALLLNGDDRRPDVVVAEAGEVENNNGDLDLERDHQRN